MTLDDLKVINDQIRQAYAMQAEARRLLVEAKKELKESPLCGIDVNNYGEIKVHVYNEKALQELFPLYSVAPFTVEDSDCHTRIAAKFDGVTYFALSKEKMPSGTDEKAVAKPVEQEAV